MSYKHVEIYTDGACLGNPGPGGWAAILKSGAVEKELSGGFHLTTNNRMELMAVVMSLKALKVPCVAEVHSDSQYVVNAWEKGWAKKWRANNWMRNKDERAQNPDLWEALFRAAERHKLKLNWVRGHAGHVYNERCDKLAVAAANAPTANDEAYERSRNA